MESQPGYDLFVRRWAWLFPFTFVFHIFEEYFGSFHQWIARVIGAELSQPQFLNMNVFFWLVMAVGIAAAMVALNGSLHLIFSIVTASYSPGVISGTVFWLPLGGYTLYLASKHFGRAQFFLLVLLGIVLHFMVLMLAFNMANRTR